MILLTTTNGSSIPSIGLGTFPFQGREMADTIKQAYKIGYRLFDTADDYRGEPGIGIAIKEMYDQKVCEREDLFLQSKISDNNAHADEPLIGVYFNKQHTFMHNHTVEDIVREKVDISLRSMCTTYLDSLLIHYPYPDYYVDIWRVMIQLKKEGLVRYIGVSNFHVRHLERLLTETGVFPEINECYVSPIGIKQNMVDYCISHNCLVMTYSPLMDLASKRIDISKLSELSEKYGKSPAQIILRWNLERDCMPLPKTKNPVRQVENYNIFDFSLTKDEVCYISSMNQDYQYLVESKICPGL